MKKLIRQDYLEAPSIQFERYDSGQPFRHLVLDDFFEPGFARSLFEEFPAFDVEKAMNENGEIGAKCVHDNLPSLGKSYRELDEYIQSPEFLGWLQRVTGIDELIYDPDYFGGGTHENRHGQDLDPHVDFNKHPKTGLHRRLNLIVYLNERWDDDWGGAIEFHKNPRLPPEQNEIKYVQPKFNRAVLFETTHWSWHGFERINLPEGDDDPRSRKSVALYFYSKTRPPEEQTKPHSTIYVERPLPDDIRPGVTLSEDRYQKIRGMLDRRDRHLQRLYGNISDLSAHVEDLVAQRDRALEMAGQGGAGSSAESRATMSALTRARRWLARKIAD
ncbi:MAG: 2OG-Fe(II) oxygenase [Wenzhouxiangellaceae bacterium]